MFFYLWSTINYKVISQYYYKQKNKTFSIGINNLIYNKWRK